MAGTHSTAPTFMLCHLPYVVHGSSVGELRGPTSPQTVLTRHDDLREARLSSHGRGSVYQVWELLPDLVDVPRKQFQSHPQT